MKAARAFFACSGRERRLFLQAVALLLAARAATLVLPFRFVARAAFRLAVPRGRPGSEDPVHCQEIIWAVARAGRSVPGGRNCLQQALAGHVLLMREGFASGLRIGVKRASDGTLKAHAWVESRGKVLIGGPAARTAKYAALPSLDRAAPSL